MKNTTTTLLSSILLFAFTAEGQGTFQNLAFESAVLIPIPNDPFNRVEAAPAFAGWTAYVNNNQEMVALYNSIFLSSAGLGIIGSGPPNPGLPIQGNYTARIEGGLVLGTSIPGDASLAQTGVVPAGAQSLQFAARPGSSSFAVALDGQSLSLVPLGIGPNYTLYGADIQAWAGQMAELRFTAFANQADPGFVNLLALDSIQFSTQAVPEPGMLGLSALGVLLWFWRRRIAQRD